jgi:hypothetical protein
MGLPVAIGGGIHPNDNQTDKKMKAKWEALMPLLGSLLACLSGCAHQQDHSFIPPSSAAVVQDVISAKASAVKAVKGDKKAAQQVVDALSKAQDDLGLYTGKVESQSALLSKVSDEANYWHAKQSKALKELWMWRAIALFSVLAVVGYIGIRTSWRFLL